MEDLNCPNCLGEGKIYDGKKMKECNICEKTGVTNNYQINAFINDL